MANMDRETLDIEKSIKLVGDLVGHEGWAIVARSLEDRVLAARNLSDIRVADLGKDKLYDELRAREKAIEIIAGWLNDIAGTAEVANQPFTEAKTSYTVIRE